MPDNFPTESELKAECRTDEGAGPVHAAGPTPGQPPVQPSLHAESRKANTLNRCIARFIDILFALLLNKLPGYVGLLAGLTYIGIADGLMGGRSIGKKIIGLKVIRRKDGRKADFRASILRNSTIGVMYLVFNVPIVGWVLAALGMAFELMLIIGSAEGMRLGDEIASTMVADEPEAA